MPRSYFFILLRRSLGFWIGLRLLLLVVVLLVPLLTPALLAPGKDPITSLGTSVLILSLTVGLLLFDAHLAGEDLLVANFGVSRLQVGMGSTVLPAIGEILVLAGSALMGR